MNTYDLMRQRAETAEARLAELVETDEAEAQIASEEIARLKARVRELEGDLADLRNAGCLPFIRSEAIRNLRADLCAAKMSAGRVHGQIGILANAAFGISDNLDTDTTLQAIEAGINDLKGRIAQDHGIVALLEAQNARLRAALTDCSHMVWNVLHNGMLVPAARRSQLEQIEAAIKAALAGTEGAT